MPHNRTRFWVGLAIIAVTIPAVGTFYTHSSATSDLRGSPISAAGRIDLASRQEDSFGSGQISLRHPPRDYRAEVDAVLARQGVFPGESLEGDETYDDIFDVDPLGDIEANRSGNVVTPDPAAQLSPGNPNLVAYSTDGPVANGDVVTAPADPDQNPTSSTQMAVASTSNQADDYGQAAGTMSDSDIYRLVVNNLDGDRRDDFVRAYVAMSAEQRADLLDSFRQQIQGGQ